nr:sigma-70 family RNA polymerase sigma factor [Parabacteroides goldsteinii]
MNLQNIRNETTLWNLFREGDEHAFSKLFELTSDSLYRYGSKFVKDEDLVKDCIQELFIKLYENRHQLPVLSNPLFYMFGSLKNLLIDTLRRNQRMIYLSPEELPFHVQFVFNQEEDEEPDDAIKARFEEVMALLSDRQKEVIYLHFQADMTYEEIAQLLGINNQSVRNIIYRAMEKVRTCLNSDMALIALFISLLR